MFLSGVATIIIQRIGRWESLAFLEYIWEQVESFTLGVSKKMIKFENFHHLNEKEFSSKSNVLGEPSLIADGGGDDLIPFSVHFSEGVLCNEEDITPNILF